MRTNRTYWTTILRVGILRGGCLLLFSFGLLLTSTGCSQGPAPADPAASLAEPWLRLLATGDPPHRVQALTELAKLPGKSSVKPVLQVALNDHQPQVRIAAIESLGRPGLLEPEQLKSLTYLLSAADPEVRMAACRALGAVRAQDSIDSLVQCMYDREPPVRLAAADAIAMLGEASVPKLTGMFTGGSAEQKVTIARVLAKTGNHAYASILVPALQDPDDMVRRTAAEAIAQMAITSAVPQLVAMVRAPLSAAMIEEFERKLTQRPNESDFDLMVILLDEDCDRKGVRRDSSKYPWLRSGAAAYGQWYKRAMERRRCDAANLARGTALEAIVRIAPPNLETILRDLLAEPDEDLGMQVSKILRDRGETARAELIAAAKDPKVPALARSRMVDILAPPPPVKNKNDTDKLRALMRDMEESASEREEAEEDQQTPLVQVSLSPDIRDLFLALLSNNEPGIRAAVAVHLGRAGVKESIPPLLDAFKTADPGVVRKTAEALQYFKDERIAPVLVAALSDKRFETSAPDIIRTLGIVGDKAASPALLRLATSNDDQSIRSAAVQALGLVADPATFAPMVEWLKKYHGESLAFSRKKVQDTERDTFRGQVWMMDQLEKKVLAFFGKVKAVEAVPPLIEMLTDTNRSFAIDVMQALGQIGDKRAVAPISTYIRNNGSYHSRTYRNYTTTAGIDALVKIRDPGGIEVLKHFAANWQNPKDPFTGKYAIDAMGRMKHPEAVAVLMKYLTDPAIDPAMKESCVGPALAAAGVAAKEPLIKLMVESLKPPERAATDPGMYAAQILAVMDKPDVNLIPDLQRIMTSKPPAHVVQRITESLAQTHHESGVKALAEILTRTDAPTRQLAALALGNIKLRTSVPSLEAALKDEDKKVRECAAFALREYGVAVTVEN